MTALPVLPAHRLERTEPEHNWLIEALWGADAVGIIGGEPKCCKSFLALGMAVSVASGSPCLDRFACLRTGRVLLFAAEDALHVVRCRLEGICAHHHIELSTLDLWVITAPTLRLDIAEDRKRLADTVEKLKPVLLILDPFVRLHRVDENVSAAVVPLLAFLREIQRRHHCAVAVVHHARKGASNTRAGQALRGSSEFHAWADSSLFIRKTADRLRMSAEHRAYPSMSPISLKLQARAGSLALVAGNEPPDDADGDQPHSPSERDRLLLALRTIDHPLPARELRARCRMRTATLCSLLHELRDEGLVIQTAEGWCCRAPPAPSHDQAAFPVSPSP